MSDQAPYLDDDSVELYRKEFPITKKYAYLNHAGVAPASLSFCNATNKWLEDFVSNGVDFPTWRKRAATCRRRFANLIGCSPREVAFVRNTSHGLALIAEGLSWKKGDRVVIMDKHYEYPANIFPWKHVADRPRFFELGNEQGKRKGKKESRLLELVRLETPEGIIPLDELRRILETGPRLLAISSAQFGTGAVADLEEIGKMCKDNGVIFCVDGIQSVGVVPLNVKDLGIDILAADSHKWMLGVMGMGVLYVDKKLLEHPPKIRPVVTGWKSVQGAWEFLNENEDLRTDARQFEEGSLPYALIEGLSASLHLLHEVSVQAISRRVGELVAHLAGELEKIDCAVSPRPEHRHHILTFEHPAIRKVYRKHDEKKRNDAFVADLKRMGIIVTERHHGVRVSPHFYNTREELDKLVSATEEILKLK